MYALHEVLRQTLEEGVEQRWERHEAAGRRFAARAEEAGLEVLAEPEYRLAPLTAVRVPEGIDGKDVQRQLLAEQGLEVGGGLGPATPPIWRVGLMGPNASEATADRVLGRAHGSPREGARPGRRLALHLDIDDLPGVRVHAHHRELPELLRVERRALPGDRQGHDPVGPRVQPLAQQPNLCARRG